MTDGSKCPAVESVPGRVSGAWVFTGTRLAVSSLFETLESGAPVEEYLEWFEGAEEWRVRAVLLGCLWDDYLHDPDGLLTLTRKIPPTLPILIEEADIHPATRQTEDPTHDENIASALTALAGKSCYLLLTTVRGNESQQACWLAGLQTTDTRGCPDYQLCPCACQSPSRMVQLLGIIYYFNPVPLTERRR